MKSLYLFKEMELNLDVSSKAVNVASVPHRSPFRYPGGKTWFVPTFRKWLSSFSARPHLLVEPFAGGGIISLTAIFENLTDKVVMVEKDEDIAAVWKTIIDGNAEWLAKKILTFDLTKENLLSELNRKNKSVKEKAFQTILKNRTFHGGILANGAGLIKNGENGKGLRSRWYPKTIATRLRYLNYVASKITFIQGDGFEVLRNYSKKMDTIFFIDPPYTVGGKKAGKRLYKYFDLNHKELFKICNTLMGDFLMTYDIANEVKQLAQYHGFQIEPIPMKNTHHAEMTEFIIGRDLSWIRQVLLIREKQANYKKRIIKKSHNSL